MKKVYSTYDVLMLHNIKNILESEGIDCVTKNESFAYSSGELPQAKFAPSVWVIDESKYHEASKILKAALSSSSAKSSNWKCASCQEYIEGQFTECWNCGANNPSIKNT